MSAMKSEPWEFASLDELLAIASALEQEAIDGYIALSERMSGMAHPDLAKVFDALVLEESDHLSKVREWSKAFGLQGTAIKPDAPETMFDDEGAGIMAPELLSAYRAFSMAVRNEERAFMFWTYVSAHARSDEIKQAAERMAREELGHVARLRRERRKAFHLERDKAVETDLKSLEEALSHHLEAMAAKASGDASSTVRGHSLAARARMGSSIDRPFELGSSLKIGDNATIGKALPLGEHLLDCYLDLGDHAKSEHDANRARRFAGQLIACIRTVRSFGTELPS
jgi:rubrerythrin